MNAWYMLAAYVGAILICLALCAASLAVMMHGIVKQRRLGGRLAFLIAAGAVTAAVLLFTNSHATYYRFNDWAVSGSTVQDIVKRYGEPDINMYTPGRGGSLWYYIYTDEGPIMPDHLEHFYRIGIDENGRAAKISDTVRKGG